MTESGAPQRSFRENMPYWGLLLYTALFYSQLGNRFPALAPLRLEFVVGTVLLIYCFRKLLSGEVPMAENALNYGAVAFLLTALMTVPFAMVKSRALSTFVDLFKFFAIYLMIVAVIDTEKRLRGFLYTYLAMIVLLFGEPFLLSLQGKGFIWNNHMWRLAGVTNYFKHPNQLGGITSANLPFFFYLMLYHKSRIIKVGCAGLIAVSLRVVMLTNSRTAFVGVVAFGFFAWMMSKHKLLGLVLVLVGAVAVWSLSSEEARSRFLSLGDATEVISGEMGHEEAGSMYSRWVLIKRGFVAFIENPILGLGLQCYTSFNGHRYGSWMPPHNTYVQALAEMGAAGFLVFAWLLIAILRNTSRTRQTELALGQPSSFIYLMSTAVTVNLCVRITVSMFGQDLYANYWWINGGLSVVFLRIATLRYWGEAGHRAQSPRQQVASGGQVLKMRATSPVHSLS